MNAWIDCMTDLEGPDTGMTKIHALPDGVVVLELEHVVDFKMRCYELYETLVECAAFVNYRRLENGNPAVLLLSFWN